jgi:hypothetical protein
VSFTEWQVAVRRVRCPDKPYGCGAVIGEPCTNLHTGAPLEHRPAHERRIQALLAIAGAHARD